MFNSNKPGGTQTRTKNLAGQGKQVTTSTVTLNLATRNVTTSSSFNKRDVKPIAGSNFSRNKAVNS